MSQFQYSHWWERLNSLSSSGQVPMGQYGATLDTATAPWSVAAMPQQDLQALAGQQRAQEARQPQQPQEEEGLVGEILGFGEPIFTALGYLYKQLSTKVLSPATHIAPTIFDADWQRQIGTDSAWDALTDGRTWSQIMKTAEKDSFGRGLAMNVLMATDPLNPEETVANWKKDLKDNPDGFNAKFFNTYSGAMDFMGVMFLDPLWIGGKYAASSRLLRTTKSKSKTLAKEAGDYDEIMGSEPVARFLSWTDGRAPEEIARHSALKNTPQAGMIADLLSKASTRDKDLIYRIGIGDEKAFRELQRTAPAVAAQYSRMKGSVRFYEQHILPTLGIKKKADRKAHMRPLKDQLTKFGDDNSLMLKLSDTEFNPFGTMVDQATGAPFQVRWLKQDEARVHNTFTTLYRPLRDGQERMLFTRSGTVEPVPLKVESAMRHYTTLRSAERAAGNVPAPAPLVASAAPSPVPTQADWLARLHNYNPAGTVAYSVATTRHLDLLDNLITPELAQLDAQGAWYRTAVEAASSTKLTPTKAGVYGSIDVLPKGGAAPRVSEFKAEFGQKVAMATMRRNPGKLIHAGWMARPVQVLAQTKEAFSRGATPSTYSAGDPQAWRKIDAYLKRVRGLDPAKRMTYVRAFMGASTEPEKLKLVEAMEAEVVEHLMKLHGITEPGTIKSIVEVTLGSRKAYVGRMADMALEAGGKKTPRGSKDGYTAIKPVTLAPDGTAIVPGPQVATQLLNEHPLLPIEDLDKAFKRDGTLLQSLLPGDRIDGVMSFFEGLNRVWKTSVLFRAGYAVRTVSDEILLSGAALGSMMYYAGAIPGAAHIAGNLPGKARNVRTRRRNYKDRTHRKLPEHELEAPRHQRGVGPVDAGRGILAGGLYDGPTGAITKKLTSSDQRALYSIHDDLLTVFREKTNYGVLDPKNPALEKDHLAAWVHALNNQLGRDPFARLFLEGATVEEGLAWMRTTQGKAYLRRLPLAARRREDWARGVAAMVDQYTLGDINLMRLAAGNKVSLRDLRRVAVDDRPPVHGGQLDYSLGTGEVSDFFNKLSDGFYTLVNKAPTDTLVRHPVADILYQRRLRELVADAEVQGVRVAERPDRLYHFEEVARQYTVKEMDRIFKDHLFSTPQTALKFAMPFFGAWRASLARWATMVGENPAIVARANQGWQGLHKPFDVVNEDGVPYEDADDEVFGFDTKASIVMRLPEPIARQFGALPLVGPGTEQFAPGRAVPLRSFNTVLQGDPWFNAGFGPFVTVPVAAILRDSPHLAQKAQEAGVLPFGTRAAWWQHALPTAGQRVVNASGEDENRAYATTFVNILRVESARYQRKERDKPPTVAEVRSKTESLSKLRTWEALLLPFSAQPMFYAKEWENEGVPKDMQFLAAKLRDYKSSLGNEEGEAVFLEEFPEAWLWTHSVSQNNSGIPANFKSWGNSRKVKHLANVAPDIFASAAGVRDADYGEFDSAVYDAQMNTEWNSDTGQKYREGRELHTFEIDASVRDGWAKFGKLMDYLRNQLEERKLLTLNDPGAEDLKDIKAKAVDYWSDQNPAWGRAYGAPDPDRAHRVREQAWLVANDQRLATDPKRARELKYLRDYLVVRRYFTQQLQGRKASGGHITLTAKSNRDLLTKWEAVRSYLGKDTRFSEVWLDRHFGNDYLQEVG